MPFKQPRADIDPRRRAGSVSRNEASDEETNGGGKLPLRTECGRRGAGRRTTRPVFEPRPIYAIHHTIKRSKIINGRGWRRSTGLAAHGLIVQLDCLMRAGLVMFARPVVTAVTLLVFVAMAFIQWSGVIGMPMFSIALTSTEQMRRAREMLANLQPPPASGRDDES